LRNANPTERVESQMSKLRGVELSFSLDILWRCKEELEKAKYPLFLDELILIIKKLAMLHNQVRERNGEGLIKKQISVKPIRVNWTTNLPDLHYMSIQLTQVMKTLATQKAGKNFNKRVDEIIELIKKLRDDYDTAIVYRNHFVQVVEGLKSNEFNQLMDTTLPKYRILLKGLREREFVKSPILKDPLLKDLPQGKIASYRSAIQKITTYETGSKAPLIEKGRGLSADLDKKSKK
jgi:hypothetical protein